MKKLLLPLVLLVSISSIKSQSTNYGIELDSTLNVNFFVSPSIQKRLMA